MYKIQLKEFTSKKEMLKQLPLIQQLYPEFTQQIYSDLLDEMLLNNYKQLVAFENGIAVGLSGFWVGTKLWCGKYLELDNVIVHPNHRSKGIGKVLTEYLNQKAIDIGCKVVALDAYTNNFPAHKFYYNLGFVPKGFHFIKFLEEQ
jgi:GNAT superfamily N-acetyltransferase